MTKSVMISVAAVMLLSGSAGALTIDSFDQTSQTFQPPTVPAPDGLGPETVSGPDMVGGFRTVEITDYSNANAAGIGVGINDSMIDPGLLEFTMSAGVSGELTLTWDANGAGLGVDLDQSGMITGLQIDVYYIDPASFDLTLIIKDFSANTAMGSIPALQLGQNYLPFGAMAGVGSVDLSDTHSVTISILSPDNSDIGIDLIQTYSEVCPCEVPAPTPAILMLPLGLWFVGRRNAS